MNYYEEVKPLVEKLKNRIPAPPLVPSRAWDPDLSKQIKGLDVKETIRASLFLWNDDLDKAHKLAQDITNSTGSLIHGIMHRRQPDYTNSKYWYRQVGSHPIFINLIQEFPGWEPFTFVDQCELTEQNNDTKIQNDLETVQSRELELLTHYCLELEGLAT